ncbi:hypothetical protein SEEC0006_15207 [Salmonella enterica subsp. enterica serovar Choleraesuis str. 0006]|nr:hypothetical protein SEEHRA23_23730 [Salmonella enterica subsp. enterica serovar Heidelberg str. SARA33]ESH49012.1 hypothetical protein SEEC0006_15207 [Salmonella enterica subsp. enterica serovar Choleraesuis str. 0006]ESO15546.1 hypothetical protein SEEA9518_06210 [Salmonella enterica subsp. enterica serovar Agona str. 400095 18]KJT91846.1 hypothetical protein SEEH2823_17075 [Salmonella enterica subsp. enterica serovar Heidelberg str. 77-2823]
MAVAVKISAKNQHFAGEQGVVAYTYSINTNRNLHHVLDMRGVDVGGNPPVISGIERKTKTGNKLKRP